MFSYSPRPITAIPNTNVYQAKIRNLSFTTSIFIRRIAKYPDTAAARNPIRSGRIFAEISLAEASPSFTTAPARITGIPKIKLYSTASSRFIPVNNAAEIVEPERDIPGTRAMP